VCIENLHVIDLKGTDVLFLTNIHPTSYWTRYGALWQTYPLDTVQKPNKISQILS